MPGRDLRSTRLVGIVETQTRDFDVVVWGATGFVGRLTAQHILEHYGTSFPWALGGRSETKLSAVRDALTAETGVDASGVPLIVGDAADTTFMRGLAERTRVACTTVGPYALYGSELVAACAATGTHYCDLTGEVFWMGRMIDAHQDQAQASGARMVHACGFDCIPADLGVFFVQHAMKARHGVPGKRVKLRVAGFKGGASGGTAASAINMLEEQSRDPEVRQRNEDPYAINPRNRRNGPDGPDSFRIAWDADFGQWTGPFIMANVDTRVVRRSNALLANAYGPDFRYEEAMLMGRGPSGFVKALGLATALRVGMAAMAVGPVRRAAASRMPAPGEGPSRRVREAGYWDVRLLAEHPSDASETLRARLTGDRDPGYGSTAKMLAESAICLARDSLTSSGGIHTPASAMGEALLDRLKQNAGVTVEIENP